MTCIVDVSRIRSRCDTVRSTRTYVSQFNSDDTCCKSHCVATIVSWPIHSLISENCNCGGPSLPFSTSLGISPTCRIAKYRSQVYANFGCVYVSLASLVEFPFTQGYQAMDPDKILPSGLARLGRATRNCVCGNGIIDTMTSYCQSIRL